MNLSAPSYYSLRKEYEQKPQPIKGKLLHIEGLSANERAYNPTVIEDNGTQYLIARVESTTSNWVIPESYDPKAVFFKKNTDGTWLPDPEIPPFLLLEDPFATWINDEDGTPLLIVAGVQIDRTAAKPSYYTSFFKGKNLHTLEREPFTKISHMKDIRLLQRKATKEIAVCTRPLIYGDNTGRIGMFNIKSIKELDTDQAFSACVFVSQVADGTWIGANKMYLLNNPITNKEEIGVLCHVAYLDPDKSQHYSAAVFKYDPEEPCNHEYPGFTPKMIAIRDNFEEGPTKTEQLKDVIFPAGLEHQQDGMVKLYAGLSDAAIGSVILPDPFA